MQDRESIWMYDPSFPLAVVGTVVYGIIFLAIAYLTLIKYRAWYFIVVVIGSAIEVAAYNLRIYSLTNTADAFCPDAHLHGPRSGPYCCWKLPSHQPAYPRCSSSIPSPHPPNSRPPPYPNICFLRCNRLSHSRERLWYRKFG